MNNKEQDKFENINNIDKYKNDSLPSIDKILNKITISLNLLIESKNCLKDMTNLNNSKFITLKDLFFDGFKTVMSDLNEVIENISNKTSTKQTDSTYNEKNIDEESPAAIKRCLNLNWCQHEMVNGNIVETRGNVITNKSSSHWCVESEEVLSGVFTARIRLNKYTRDSNSWACTIGLIKADSTHKTTDGYFYDSVILLNDCKLPTPFTGDSSRSKTILNNHLHCEGDEIIIKRDTDNNVYFGINDVKSCELAYENISGDFRIVLGFFTDYSTVDEFELVYLF